VTDGKTLTVDRPEVVGTAEARDELPPGEQRTHRLFAVAHCLRLHLADTDTDTDAPDPQDGA
jgi:hypothetical protein